MCFEPTARPPEPPRTGLAAGTERLTLVASDGNEAAATFAATSADSAPGVVILPDVRGLHPYYEALAEAFAGAGVHALAVDFYGRTAGPGHRDGEFDYAPHRAAVTDEQVRADARAARAELERRGVQRVYVLGFCFGGRAAFLQGTEEGVAGVVGFYGWPARQEEGGTSPLEEARAGRLQAPVLALYGGADERIPEDDAVAFAEALRAAHVPAETIVYDGAPHSFFDRSMSDHAEACEDAWFRVFRFMGLATLQT
ncbi:MAG TPA: dienelactone hydrolase family protein [Gaiellaceae bacterium]